MCWHQKVGKLVCQTHRDELMVLSDDGKQRTRTIVLTYQLLILIPTIIL